MNMSDEEKAYIVEQLQSLTSKRPLFFLKFCECEKYAQDVCDGNLYANTPEHFRQQEIESGERGQGDQLELISSIETEKVAIYDAETDELFMTAPKGTLRIQFREDDKIPLVSFVGIQLDEMKLVYADETHADFLFPFSDEEYETMEKKFGKYCAIVGARELERKVKEYSLVNNCEYIFDRIDYCTQNRIDRIKAFNKSAKERFLFKNEDLSYQREYRLAFAHEIPIDHFISIGKFEEAKILNTNGIRNMKFSIQYDSHKK